MLRRSQNGWLFLGALLSFALTLVALLQVGERFATVTQGAEPFDLQNELTLNAIFTQLPTYTDQSHRLYLLFTLVDYLFPFCAGLWVAAAAAFSVRHALLIYLAPTVGWLATLLLLCKQAKLGTLNVTQGLLLLGLHYGVVWWRNGRRTNTTAASGGS